MKRLFYKIIRDISIGIIPVYYHSNKIRKNNIIYASLFFFLLQIKHFYFSFLADSRSRSYLYSAS